MVTPIDLSAINFFTPIASFLFVFVVVYAILIKTEILGSNKGMNALIGFVMAVVFVSFSSLGTYVNNIIPWFIVLLVILFFILLVAKFTTKDFDKMMTKGFAWVVVIIFIIVFLIVAINVFNPVFHPDKILAQSSDSEPHAISQLIYFLFYSQWAGVVLLLIIAAIVAWYVTKK